MNLTSLLQYESSNYRGAQTQSREINEFVALSLRFLMEHYFERVASSFVLVLSCRRARPLNFYNHILEMLFANIANVSLQLVCLNSTRPERVEGTRLHNLLLVDSLDAFLDIDVVSYSKLYDTNEHYYIILHQRDRQIPLDMQGIFEYCWQHQLINCNVQVQTAQGEIYMYSYYPYTAQHCDQVVPVIINQFVGHSWVHTNFFPAKLRNFHGCPLGVAVRVIPPFLEVRKHFRRTRSYKVAGFEGCLLNQLSDHLNYTMNVTVAAGDDRSGNFCCGVLALLANGTADLGLGYYRKRTITSLNTTTTFPHYQNTLVASVFFNAHNLTTFETLVYPFQLYTWLVVVISFALVLLTGSRVQQYIVATGQREVPVNIWHLLATTFGISHNSRPQQTQNRLLFLSWLWSTFLIRSMYSAFLYHLFRDNVHQQLPNRLTDLLVHNYETVFTLFTKPEVVDLPLFNNLSTMHSTILDTFVEYAPVEYLEQHIHGYQVAITSRDFLTYYVNTFHKAGLYRILPEAVNTQQLTIYLPKHSFLVNQLDETLLHIQSVGLTDHCKTRHLSDNYFRSMHLFGQRLIQQKDLLSIYIICGVLEILALCIFILELLSGKSSKLRRIFQ